VTDTVLLFECKKCDKKDRIPPEGITCGNVACPRCGEKQEYINYGYGFKETLWLLKSTSTRKRPRSN
jgi:hypothetical protein